MRGIGSGQHDTGDVKAAVKKKAAPAAPSISVAQDNWTAPAMMPMMQMPSRKRMAANHDGLMGKIAGRRI